MFYKLALCLRVREGVSFGIEDGGLMPGKRLGIATGKPIGRQALRVCEGKASGGGDATSDARGADCLFLDGTVNPIGATRKDCAGRHGLVSPWG